MILRHARLNFRSLWSASVPFYNWMTLGALFSACGTSLLAWGSLDRRIRASFRESKAQQAAQLFQHTCEQYGANLCCSTFPTRSNVRFLHGVPKHENPQGPRMCEAVPRKRLDFRHVPQPRVFQMPSTMKQVCDGSTGGYNLGESTKCVIVEVKSFLRHILPAETSCRILVRTRGFVTSYPRPNFCVEHIATQSQMICFFCQEARSTEHVTQILKRFCPVSPEPQVIIKNFQLINSQFSQFSQIFQFSQFLSFLSFLFLGLLERRL